jgi:opacity protein-like surface antigen
MFNVVIKTQLWERITPFAGVGIGGVINTLWADDIVAFGRVVHGDDSDCVFGWQGFIGTKYSITPQWDLSLTYRYLWTDESSWRVDTFTPVGFTRERISIDSSEVHAVVLGATFRF